MKNPKTNKKHGAQPFLKGKAVISAVMLLLVAVCTQAYIGYRLTQIRHQLTITEGMEAQRLGQDGEWVALPILNGNVTLSPEMLMPGESRTTLIRIRNNASNGVIGGVIEVTEATAGIATSFLCNSSGSTGVKYKVDGSRFFVRVPTPQAWQLFGLNYLADGAMPIGPANATIMLSRQNVLSEYPGECA